jgi:hypothetical protein
MFRLAHQSSPAAQDRMGTAAAWHQVQFVRRDRSGADKQTIEWWRLNCNRWAGAEGAA